MLRPLPGRGQTMLLQAGAARRPVLLIDESYNANPASMRAAIETAAEVAGRQKWERLVVVLGDMLELGEDARRFHAELASALAGTDVVFACGPHMTRNR